MWKVKESTWCGGLGYLLKTKGLSRRHTFSHLEFVSRNNVIQTTIISIFFSHVYMPCFIAHIKKKVSLGSSSFAVVIPFTANLRANRWLSYEHFYHKIYLVPSSSQLTQYFLYLTLGQCILDAFERKGVFLVTIFQVLEGCGPGSFLSLSSSHMEEFAYTIQSLLLHKQH